MLLESAVYDLEETVYHTKEKKNAKSEVKKAQVSDLNAILQKIHDLKR